jgi:hypothetical protein
VGREDSWEFVQSSLLKVWSDLSDQNGVDIESQRQLGNCSMYGSTYAWILF